MTPWMWELYFALRLALHGTDVRIRLVEDVGWDGGDTVWILLRGERRDWRRTGLSYPVTREMLVDHPDMVPHVAVALAAQMRRQLAHVRVSERERMHVCSALEEGAAPFRLIAREVGYGKRGLPLMSPERARRAVQSCVSLGLVESFEVQRRSHGWYPSVKRPMTVYRATEHGRALWQELRRELAMARAPGVSIKLDDGPRMPRIVPLGSPLTPEAQARVYRHERVGQTTFIREREA